MPFFRTFKFSPVCKSGCFIVYRSYLSKHLSRSFSRFKIFSISKTNKTNDTIVSPSSQDEK